MSVESRRDPDALLARVQREEAKRRRGRLKVFFGAAAGVGKTYAMLLAAREKRAEGLDVAVGIVETHNRAETAALLEGLEVIPPRVIEYRGTIIQEFDLDAALKRRPAIILVDELAHTNAEGSRHPKRWNDVEELIDAGIDVYTALNVQHLESLNDVVGSITGIRVQETVPDSAFDRADEVELIDLPPDELIERLREGKVYMPQQARAAIENFFRKGNLIALRELALRTTADRVDAAMREYRDGHAIRDIWAAGERLLVAIGPYENAEHLVRAGKRMATALRAPWIAVYVETPELLRLSEAERDRRIALLRLAESLGAEAVTLGGSSAGEEIANYVRTRNVTRVLIGRPRRALWRRLIRPSTYGELLDRLDGVDIHVAGGAERTAALQSPVLARSRVWLEASGSAPDKPRWPGYAWATAAMGASTAVGLAISPLFELANIVMVYLLAVVLVANRFGRGPAILSSVLGVAAFDFVFVPPQLTFAVSDWQYVVTFVIMLAVALLISNLTASVRLQARVAGHRERRTALLYAMSRELAATRGLDAMARTAVRHMSEVFSSQVAVLLPDPGGRVRHPRGEGLSGSLHGADLDIAQWVQERGEPAGLGTSTLPGSDVLFLPIKGSQAVLGVLAVLPANPRHVLLPEQFHLLETFAGQLALALERAQLAERAQQAGIAAEMEGLRNTLLASISHDLRTPLAIIAGACSSIADKGDALAPEERRALAASVFEHSRRMSGIVDNVLNLIRLESGGAVARPEWVSLEEIAGSALNRLGAALAGHSVQLNLKEAPALIYADPVLLEQLIFNLLENAAKYTPAGSRISLAARRAANAVELLVADDGPGFPSDIDPPSLFEKFQRGRPEGAQGGVGLGLAICRAIALAHGGEIRAERIPAGGALFVLTLPQSAAAPEVPREEAA